jgi:hypothetical protein
LTKFLLALIAFGAASENAFAQSYPSRPTFLSAGIGCSPNLFALNILADPIARSFLCIGDYPNNIGNNGRLFLITPGLIPGDVIELRPFDSGSGAGILFLGGDPGAGPQRDFAQSRLAKFYLATCRCSAGIGNRSDLGRFRAGATIACGRDCSE